MKDSIVIARSLYKAIKELEEAHARNDLFAEGINDAITKADLESAVESAEDYLAQVLESLKQWTIEP